MIRITITVEAYEVIAVRVAFGSVGYEAEPGEAMPGMSRAKRLTGIS